MRTIVLLLFITYALCISCKKEAVITHSETKKILVIDTVYSVNDTLEKVLAKALIEDSLDFDNWEPFIVFKSGHLFSGTGKDALLFTNPKDRALQVIWYTESNGTWIKNDELTFTKALLVQFDLRIADYNFDGHGDFYVQQSASNGHSISKGFLITIDPKNKKLIYHTEARELGNMRPEHNEKTVYSEEYNPCPVLKGDPCTIANRWKNGKLSSVGKNCPECPETL